MLRVPTLAQLRAASKTAVLKRVQTGSAALKRTFQKCVPVAKRVVPTLAAVYGYDYFVNNSKQLLYLPSVNEKELKTMAEVATEFECDEQLRKVDLSKSQTFQYVKMVSKMPLPADADFDTQLENYRNALDKMLVKHYRDGLFGPFHNKTRKQLVDTIVVLTMNEALHADTHYAFYTGSNAMVNSMFLRTMLQSARGCEPSPHYFFMRRNNEHLAHVTDPKSYMLSFPEVSFTVPGTVTGVVEKRVTLQHDRKPETQDAFVSANTTVLGNCLPNAFNAENSLLFVAKAGCTSVEQQATSAGLGGSPIVLLMSDLKSALSNTGLTNAPMDWDQLYMQSIVGSKYFKEHQEELTGLCKNHRHRSALIQILVKKDRVQEGGHFLAKPGGCPVANRDLAEDLEKLQQGTLSRELSPKEVDAMQARLLMRPQDFSDPKSGNMMNVVLFGEKDKYEATLVKLRAVAKDLNDH